MPAPALPSHSPDALPAVARRGLALGAVALHAAGAWALLQLEPVRQTLGEVAPIVVDWIAPPEPPAPAAPPPPKPQPIRKLQPKPVIVSEPAPTPEPPAFVAPPAPPPEPVAAAPEPVAMVAAAPAPPSPPAPPTIAITAVEYLTPPVLTYPAAARRAREQGQVHVRVLVDARGTPQQTTLIRSSGHARLDEAALATVRRTRFKPYTENGLPLPFWVVMPLVFELEN
ncbi:MAG: TonB family protein [Ideonella sp.]|nr:TonB family protein [Ideonella sp.]MCC7456278.1 TonB family protein [Nitrospira sp.]